jgi:hypothetical protein
MQVTDENVLVDVNGYAVEADDAANWLLAHPAVADVYYDGGKMSQDGARAWLAYGCARVVDPGADTGRVLSVGLGDALWVAWDSGMAVFHHAAEYGDWSWDEEKRTFTVAS